MTKRIKPYSAGWYRQATLIAFDALPVIYPCGKCRHPVIDGLCCQTCDDDKPREDLE